MDEENLVTSLVPAIKEQLESKETIYVKKAYDRLIKQNLEIDDVLMMMALCLADETNRMFIDKRSFDGKRYETMLAALPELPEG